MQDENNWKIFYSIVKKRCEKLIEYGIWEDIDSLSLKSWLNNFTTDEERFFSAIILNSLTYRSQDHVLSMLYDLLTRDLHNSWRINKDPLYSKTENPYELLKKGYGDIGFRIVSAIKESDPPSKSGNHMTFLLNHEMSVHSKWIIKPNNIAKIYTEENIRCFVLLDDISCTGEQMVSILDEIDMDSFPDARFYVMLCTIHEKGFKYILSKYPRVKIIYTEWLNEKNDFFETILLNETNYPTKEDAINAYKGYIIKKNIKWKKVLGKGNLSLTYAFSHNVPNNSIPLLFYKDKSFVNLLKKRA